ncbi:hypothetical protein D3C81_881400 [compost metagenome]
MRHHFVVHKLIPDRRHNHAVQDEHAAEFLCVQHRQILKFSLFGDQGFAYFCGNPKYGRLFLRKP